MKKSQARKAKAEHPTRGAGSRGVDSLESASSISGAGVESGSSSDETTGVETVDTLTAKVAKLEDALLRAKAEAQNIQRRALTERSQAVLYANAELVKSLLVVIDDFERSLAASKESDNLQAVVDGVQMVYGNFVKALRLQGLDQIEALHKPFDPSVHEAVLQQPSNDYPAGTVLTEVAKGYRLRDRVIRPAQVIVSKAVEDSEETAID